MTPNNKINIFIGAIVAKCRSVIKLEKIGGIIVESIWLDFSLPGSRAFNWCYDFKRVN